MPVDGPQKHRGLIQQFVVIGPEHAQLHGIKRGGHPVTDGIGDQHAIAVFIQLFNLIKVAAHHVARLVQHLEFHAVIGREPAGEGLVLNGFGAEQILQAVALVPKDFDAANDFAVGIGDGGHGNLHR